MLTFSRTQLSGVILLPLLGLGGSGCSRIEPSQPQAQLSPASDHAPAESAALSAPPRLLPAVEATTPVAPAPTSPPRVAELFESLISPEVEADVWDRHHQELVEFGASAVPYLASQLQQGTDVQREMAATLLAFYGPEAVQLAAPALVFALKDSSEFVRANAAAALVQTPEHAESGTAALLLLLDSENPQLRQMAAMNLSSIGPEAVPHVESLTRVLARENPPEVLVPVIDLLGRLGPVAEPAVPRLQQIKFEQPGELANAAVSALERIQTDAAEVP